MGFPSDVVRVGMRTKVTSDFLGVFAPLYCNSLSSHPPFEGYQVRRITLQKPSRFAPRRLQLIHDTITSGESHTAGAEYELYTMLATTCQPDGVQSLALLDPRNYPV